MSAALQCAPKPSTSPCHRASIFSHPIGHTPIAIPLSTPPDRYPSALCHQIGIDMEFTAAWREIPSPEGPLWCYLSTEDMIADSGWNKTQIELGLVRGGVEWNPGPHRLLAPKYSDFKAKTGWTAEQQQVTFLRGCVEWNPDPKRPRGRPKGSKSSAKGVLAIDEVLEVTMKDKAHASNSPSRNTPSIILEDVAREIESSKRTQKNPPGTVPTGRLEYERLLARSIYRKLNHVQIAPGVTSVTVLQ